jgi:hypothetical protein
MKRFDSNLIEYSRGKYVLYEDHKKELKILQLKIKKLKKEYKKATTTEAYKHYFNNMEPIDPGSSW